MLEIILLIVIPFAFILLMIYWLTGWATRTVTRDIHAKIRAAEMLVEHHQLPEEWLAPYRAKLSSIQMPGAGDQEVAQVVEAARNDCLQRIDELIELFKEGSLTDTPETRDSVVAALQSERCRLEEEAWQEILMANSAEMERIRQNDDG
jgi:hypothetical protein